MHHGQSDVQEIFEARSVCAVRLRPLQFDPLRSFVLPKLVLQDGRHHLHSQERNLKNFYSGFQRDARSKTFPMEPSVTNASIQQRRRQAPTAAIDQCVLQYALSKGLILLTCGICGNLIRFLHTLTIPDAHFDAAQAQVILGEALHAAFPPSVAV